MTKVERGTYDEDGDRTLFDEAMQDFCSSGAAVPTTLTAEQLILAAKQLVNDLGMEPLDLVLLVHPLEHETVVDALRRHFQAAGMGTVTVATADGPRDVGVPLAFAGVKVFESTLIPAGEVRLAPAPNPSRALTVKP